ncbi:MAG: hypothetical protein JO072_07075 [Parafilimonas sp.]|nr:hypothetical protein [Parafilimonas sp.]
MGNEKKELSKNTGNEDAPLKNDPGTDNTTDPQEHMEGPISSIMQKGKEQVEENDIKDKAEGKE